MFSGIIRAPTAHQYFDYEGVLHRSSHHRAASYQELFFDLVFVYSIAIFGERYIEDMRWPTLRVYLLRFAMVLKIWMTVNAYYNRFKTDDALQLIYLILSMFFTIGFVNSMEENIITQQSLLIYITNFIIWAVMTARIIYYDWMGAWWIVLHQGIEQILVIVFSVVGYFVSCTLREWILWTMIAVIYLWPIAMVNIRKRAPELATKGWIPIEYRIAAISIEHMVERWGLLIIIACGECVKGLFTTLEVEMPPMFIKGSHWNPYYLLILSALGITASLLMLYFTIQGSKVHVHALRYSGYTGWSWLGLQQAYLALLALFGNALTTLLRLETDSRFGEHQDEHNDTDEDHHEAKHASLEEHQLVLTDELRWTFVGSLATSLFMWMLMTNMHVLGEERGVHNLRMKYRNLVRIWVMAFILMIPRMYESACVPELIHTIFFLVLALCIFETWAHGKK